MDERANSVVDLDSVGCMMDRFGSNSSLRQFNDDLSKRENLNLQRISIGISLESKFHDACLRRHKP